MITQEDKHHINDNRERIDKIPNPVIPMRTYTIDWGPRKRGQGKRSGGMIVGAMGGGIVGKKEYTVPDLSEFTDEQQEDLSLLEHFYQVVKYYKGISFGLSHIQSMYYALID